ncbi:DUF167 domain-containing protein [Candidatus Woesearchaeota archaeon]|nr:DUF167 domain-containing protein [Candidatus Woesearchaeota archaeon]
MEIKVNPGKRETKIIGEKNGILIVDVKGKAENNEANKEIIRFFSKKYGKKVKIIRGLKSKRKIIKFL